MGHLDKYCMPCNKVAEITKQGYFNCSDLACPTNKHVTGLVLNKEQQDMYKRKHGIKS